MDKKIDTVREATDKLCHQIYDVLPISPALKLLDDGKLYALITAHDEAIRRECAERAVAWQMRLCTTDEWPCKTCSECHDLRDAILSAEPAQGDGKQEGDIAADEARVWEALNVGRSMAEALRLSGDCYSAGDWEHAKAGYKRLLESYQAMQAAEVKRRLKEAKE